MTKNCWITDEPIVIDDVIEKVVRREAGAVNTFIGTVREFTNNKQTLFLEYQAYESMAEKKLTEITEEITEKWGNAHAAIAHRIGRLDISDVAVVIAVSTPHRKDAFEASRYGIERLKQIVPIWKKEHWKDGTSWIGDQQHTTSYEKNIPSKEEMKYD
ncbi:MAG TPA: molybdenum cofactor biosynthesis protein MoaE [Virgibacillus sp.]|nr:molybdenum cofactor biosynthesis protein MoaE [Virgibacillus sp.]